MLEIPPEIVKTCALHSSFDDLQPVQIQILYSSCDSSLIKTEAVVFGVGSGKMAPNRFTDARLIFSCDVEEHKLVHFESSHCEKVPKYTISHDEDWY